MRVLRWSFRRMMRSPGPSVAAIVCLALGVGVLAAAFTLLYSVILKSLPYGQSDRLVTIWEIKLEDPGSLLPVSPGTFLDLSEQSQSFVAISAYRALQLPLVHGGDREALSAAEVTPGFFSNVLRLPPVQGRAFLPADARPGTERVVILSHDYWVRRFGSDPRILGEKIVLGDSPHVVIGILPESFKFENPDPDRLHKIEVWRPLSLKPSEREKRSWRYLLLIGRLDDSTYVERAQSELTTFASSIAGQYPKTNDGYSLKMISLKDRLVGHVRRQLWLLFAAAAIVLLAACGNVANLLICQAVHRYRDFAIHAALGGSRRHVLKEILAESALLASAGGLVGVFLAIWFVDLLILLSPVSLPRVNGAQVTTTAALVTLGTSTLATLLCTLPAIRHTWSVILIPFHRTQTLEIDRFHKSSLSKAVVGLQVTMAAILLICGGLLLKSFQKVKNEDLGFSPQDVLTTEIRLPWSRYPEDHHIVSFYGELLSRVTELPGVAAAGLAKDVPLRSQETSTEVTVDTELGQQVAEIATRIVSDSYFETMGIELQRGEVFDINDMSRNTGSLVVNSSFADRFWPNGQTTGRRVTIGWFGREVSGVVVGIVADVRHRRIEDVAEPAIYIPFRALPYRDLALVVRGDRETLHSLPSAIRITITDLDNNLIPRPVETMKETVADATALRRLLATFTVTFASISVVLCCVGLYGVMSYLVRRSTRQIGIRIALGATARDVLKDVLQTALTVVARGLLLGALSSLLIKRLVESFLYEASFFDPSVFAATIAILLAVALVASYLPARSAIKLEAASCLRYE